MSKIVISCDVGIINLAFVKAKIENFKIVDILDAIVIDLTSIKHVKVNKSECKLFHSNDACDRLNHFFQEYDDLFNDVDILLIERQPITGLVHVEQLIHNKFRSKSLLISPNKMHKWMKINHLDYDQRKQQTTKFADQYLGKCETFVSRLRKHDMADALCILMFWLHTEKEKYEKLQKEKEMEERLNNTLISFKCGTLSVPDFLNSFKFESK